MKKLLKEIKDDLNFIKSHTLQPKWYKIFKVFMILGFLTGYLFWSCQQLSAGAMPKR